MKLYRYFCLGFLLAIGLAACSKQPQQINISGIWGGNLTSGVAEPLGFVKLELKQTGTSVTGSAIFKVLTCLENATLEGTVKDGQLEFAINHKTATMTLKGAVTSTTMSGIFLAENCSDQRGTFTLSKGVSDPNPEPDNPLDPIGTWQGKLNSEGGFQLHLTTTLERYEDVVIGDVFINGLPCLETGFLFGKLKAERLEAEITAPAASLILAATFQEAGLKGTYTLSGTLCQDQGTLVLTRASSEAMLDAELKNLLDQHGVYPLQTGAIPDPKKVELGRLLMHDKELSGNRDTACATCHHARMQTVDQLSLSIGTGGTGLGATRQGDFQSRHAQDLFNRGLEAWHSFFWDGRVSGNAQEGFVTPAGTQLPAGLENLLAAQAMFPVTARGEMRGEVGDKDVRGKTNELASFSDDDFTGVWSALMQRLLAIDDYSQMFKDAYPNVPETALGFQHAANAIAAFEIAAFTSLESPFDQYLTGDAAALNEAAKRGALLFYGDAGCAVCHSGSLQTDQAFHNIGIPQLGPGKSESAPLDLGRYLMTGLEADKFAFRTPSLRNVALTAPYMHNGAFTSLEQVIRHYDAPTDSLYAYTGSTLEPELQALLHNDSATINLILATLDTKDLPDNLLLTRQQIDYLIAFLETLTDPKALNLSDAVPNTVPSGLPVDK